MFKKTVLLLIGFTSLGIGVIGIYVPLLPTTPLVLLALFCFSKSSDRFHSWLKSTTLYEKYVKEFKETRSITMKNKIKILLFLYVSVGVSIVYINNSIIRAALIGMLILQTFVLMFIVKTRKIKE
ncbi:YbaN family protein [Fictibacillus gelatini]|uniref:YbaN family protein n=1 Tax=Fictibacillus gelatini TaxID=225985 RepID=UPI000420742E|nr:YbaN family protein [Fictibacillus gelatini]